MMQAGAREAGIRLGADQWRRIWLENFRQRFSDQPMTEQARDMHLATVEAFLLAHPAPKYVTIPVLRSYVRGKDALAIEALGFFYRRVVKSNVHADELRGLWGSAGKGGMVKTEGKVTNVPAAGLALGDSGAGGRASVVDGERVKSKNQTSRGSADGDSRKFPDFALNEASSLLARLKEEVRVRNFSQHTLKNYGREVARFLDRLTPESSRNWSKAFKDHLIWLRETRGLAANSVNLAAAAISFFFEEVLEMEPGEDLLVRMKTDKALPRVH